MKKLYSLSILAAVILSGCQNESIVENLPESSIFYATIEDNNTKTSLDENRNVLWKQGDQISVFDGNTINKRYQVTDASDGKTSATLDVINGGGYAAGTELVNNVAFYPYAAGNEIAKNGAGYNISCTLPATQTYAAGSFGNGAFPMVAVSGSTSDKNLSFKNVLGGLKLQLKGTASIRSITVTGNNNEILYGTALVTAANGSTPSIALSNSECKTVTLDCGSGVQLNTTTATVFIIALPPMTMTGGFTVVATDTDGKQMQIKTIKSQSIARSSLLIMPEVTYAGVMSSTQCVDLGLPSGVKWATFNVGATAPEGYGDYFAWGATEPLYEAGYAQEESQSYWKTGKTDGYIWRNTPYQTVNDPGEVDTKWSKYIGSTTSSDKAGGTSDANAMKTVLDLSDDAARANWGGDWRMPTNEEWSELKNNCTWTWKTLNGINGYEVKSNNNGNWIFLPAAGYRYAKILLNVGELGDYWSSSLNTAQTHEARGLDSKSSSFDTEGSYFRLDGFTVRPVLSDDPNCGITGVALNKATTSLIIGTNETLTATVSKNDGAVNTQVEWSSSNTAVATVDYTGKVTAVSTGTTTITAKTVFGGFTATCNVIVNQYVDLGLSVKWATFNVGATKPEEYGDYFAWGETTPKSDYSWYTYKYGTDFSQFLDKYTFNLNNTMFSDGKIFLDPEDDAAHVNWGGDWRMPTQDEWIELKDNCTWEWTTLNTIKGFKVTSKTDVSKCIFLPAVVYRSDRNPTNSGRLCAYWSRSLNYSDDHCAMRFSFDYFSSTGSDSRSVGSDSRCNGLTVRPVCPVQK